MQTEFKFHRIQYGVLLIIRKTSEAKNKPAVHAADIASNREQL